MTQTTHEAPLDFFLSELLDEQQSLSAVDQFAHTLTIDIPTRYFLKTRDNARVYRVMPHIQEFGLEDLSIGALEHSNSSSGRG